MRQQTPEKAVVSTPILRRAETTMPETRAGEGTGSGWTEYVSPGPFKRFGNLKSGRQWQRATASGGCGVAGCAGPGAGHVHEETELMVDVERRVT